MSKRVTAADVARSLGLSRATVGFVLNDTPGQSISEATRKRVMAEATRLGYRPHTAARALASGRSHIVLMLLPDWPRQHSMQAHLDEAELVLDRAGYSLVTTTPHPGGRAVPLWESLDPDVVVALAPISDEQFAQISATRARTIIPGRDRLAGIELHFADGPRVQLEHLIERGSRRIAFAGTSDARLADLMTERRALAEHTHRELTGEPLVASAELDAGSVLDVVTGWLAEGVDGVVAYNDEVAALVLGAAMRCGAEVPGALAIVGHDDSPLASLLVPALSSVRVDTAELGRFLAELALSRATDAPAPAAGPVTEVTLVRRETS